MQKFILVTGITLLSFIIQTIFARVLGSWWTPNFVLIAVVFFNLSRGLRTSLAAAFFGGFLLDSFSGSILGVNIFSLVICAFLVSWLKMYIYQPGVAESRGLLVFVIAAGNSLIQYIVIASQVDVGLGEAMRSFIIPEILWTTLVASYTLERLKQCALKLFA